MKDNNVNIQSSKHVLLTGAGFTKNFGTPLASEMWAHIFNHKKIQAQPKIKKLMLDNFDYESIYDSIMMEDSTYTPAERKAINDAVWSAYNYMDTILTEYIVNHPHPLEVKNVSDLIHCFGEQSNKSFIFTLNQDLFFERLYRNIAYAKLSIPGFKNDPKWFNTIFNETLNSSHCCRLPDNKKLNCNKDILSDGNFFLIKLHGSYNWRSFDGKIKMVLGRGKTEQIQKEPLLKYYLEIFEKVLSQNQRRLLIVGYSFGDYHINRIISNAVRDHGLMIYIISPVSPEEFKKKLCEKPGLSLNIWQKMSRYFQSNLNDIFSEDMDKYKAIKQNFYDVFFESF